MAQYVTSGLRPGNKLFFVGVITVRHRMSARRCPAKAWPSAKTARFVQVRQRRMLSGRQGTAGRPANIRQKQRWGSRCKPVVMVRLRAHNRQGYTPSNGWKVGKVEGPPAGKARSRLTKARYMPARREGFKASGYEPVKKRAMGEPAVVQKKNWSQREVRKVGVGTGNNSCIQQTGWVTINKLGRCQPCGDKVGC